MAGCPLCEKHRGAGPLRGELVARVGAYWIYHVAPDETGAAELGHLYIESDRHVPYLADLAAGEAEELGGLRTRVAAALRQAVDPELVMAAVIGSGVAHFREHVFARFRGTPSDLPWHQSGEAAPRADAAAIRDLAERIAALLSGA